jgi:Ser/Thr protein kinase RdoA (MazF antagonist)
MNGSDARIQPDPALDDFLRGSGLLRAGEQARCEPLAGGVSSDIWRVDIGNRTLCVKRALAKLKVQADWNAPLSRNAYEWAWMRFAAQHCPDNVPSPVAHDEAAGFFAMSFLAPAEHPVWKQQLMQGQVVVATARAVGAVLGRLHAASARRPDIADAFETVDNFYALRLEPYLIAPAARHPSLAAQLHELVALTAGTQRALVHGDVSPKNILVGPRGPVLLDAECAWYGDPAFDLAFCLNHLLLKGLVRPGERKLLAASFDALAAGYFEHVAWEPKDRLEQRAARLLPVLLLARVDGKSPVEYMVQDVQRALVRAVAVPLVLTPALRLQEVESAWFGAIEAAA